MSARQVLQVFDDYQKSRTHFVQSVAELSSNPRNVDLLHKAGVLQILRPLLMDIVPTIQQTAALALGRLANHNDDLAQSVVNGDILPHLIYSMQNQNKFYKKAAAFVLRAVAKHSPKLAQDVVDAGALANLVACLEDFDPGIKEAGAWAIGYIARHNDELAHAVVESGAVSQLVLCLQEPEVSLKRITASALSEVSKHSATLAQMVADAGSIVHLAHELRSDDAKVKRHAFSALSQIAKHNQDLAELVVEAEIFPFVLTCLKDEDEYVKKNVATLIREVSKHNVELAKLVVNNGGVGALVDFVGETRGSTRLPAVMALGFIAGLSEVGAAATIKAKGVIQLTLLVGPSENEDDNIKSAACWALGQVGRHSPQHAQDVAEANAFPLMLDCALTDGSEDLQVKAKKALKLVLNKCLHLPALDALLQRAPASILKYVVAQYSKILPHNPSARRLFITSGGLKKVMSMATEDGSDLASHITVIQSCFPEDVRNYYTPGYPEQLLARVEQYNPPTV